MNNIMITTGNPGYSRIVKSMAVVDDHASRAMRNQTVSESAKTGIIKKYYVDHGLPLTQGARFPTRDVMMDELNRLKIEIREKEEELRSLGREISSAKRAKDADTSSVEAATESASDIVARAEFKASQIIADANAEGVRIAQQAQNDGYLEGFSKGHEDAVQEFKAQNEPLAVEIAGLLDTLSGYYADLLAKNNQDLVNLAMATARKVVGGALETNPELVASMLRGIVEEHSHAEYIKITLSPDLVPINAQAGTDVRALLESMADNVTVTVDRDASAGTAIAETPGGLVDASIETQISNLAQMTQSNI